ncbi:hypothetical protein BDV96DRAFT_361562 [Lophiotrema nucula]|uniref:Uncharacterized protein n=1 Tax=Lophiotrema nucula TaxID=690887 RepID=A0A6A5ZGU4_9PLEO|nr:hypothetical protein BDV96DRAFT_361562 [Lophiotrema nucula]
MQPKKEAESFPLTPSHPRHYSTVAKTTCLTVNGMSPSTSISKINASATTASGRTVVTVSTVFLAICTVNLPSKTELSVALPPTLNSTASKNDPRRARLNYAFLPEQGGEEHPAREHGSLHRRGSQALRVSGTGGSGRACISWMRRRVISTSGWGSRWTRCFRVEDEMVEAEVLGCGVLIGRKIGVSGFGSTFDVDLGRIWHDIFG